MMHTTLVRCPECNSEKYSLPRLITWIQGGLIGGLITMFLGAVFMLTHLPSPPAALAAVVVLPTVIALIVLSFMEDFR
jgi:hypothetical protein